MDNKIKELTEKIYLEGIEKGNEEANRVICEAQEKEALLIKEAEEKGARIISDAKRKSQELQRNTEAELGLFGKQMINTLKTEIINLINGEICNSLVKATFADKKFIRKMILTLVENFAKKEQLIIQTEDAGELTEYLEANTKGILNNKLQIEQVNGLKTSFVIMPVDGSYKVSFGEEEFINYFKELLRPQLVKILFKENSYE